MRIRHKHKRSKLTEEVFVFPIDLGDCKYYVHTCTIIYYKHEFFFFLDALPVL